MQHLYSINEISSLVSPVARAYGAERVVLFGSYARGDATRESDIDLRIDRGRIKGFFQLAGFQRELEEKLSASVDVVTTGALDDDFLERIKNEEVVVYEQ